jgi:hypothetical protein
MFEKYCIDSDIVFYTDALNDCRVVSCMNNYLGR